MTTIHWLDVLFIAALMILAMALVVRYIFWSVDQDGQRLARLETDGAYRQEELLALDRELTSDPTNARLRRQRADLRRFDRNHAGVAEDLEVYLKAVPADDADRSVFDFAGSLGTGRSEGADGGALRIDHERF